MCKQTRYFGKKKKTDLTDFEKTEIDGYKERFSKWHIKQIDLLTFCINLLFTLSIGVSGFILSNQDKELFNDAVIVKSYSLTKTSLFLLVLSSTIGVLGLVARLNDFRLTKNIAKFRRRIFELQNDIKYEDTDESNEKSLRSRISNLRCWTHFLGTFTWGAFYIQLFLFIITIWIIVLNV